MKNHKILFKDGKVEWVTKIEFDNIWKQSTKTSNGKFFLGKNSYLFEDIKRTEAPKKRQMFDVKQYIANKNPKNRIKAIESIMKGLQNYIKSDRYRGTEAPKNLFKNMQFSWKEAKGENPCPP